MEEKASEIDELSNATENAIATLTVSTTNSDNAIKVGSIIFAGHGVNIPNSLPCTGGLYNTTNKYANLINKIGLYYGGRISTQSSSTAFSNRSGRVVSIAMDEVTKYIYVTIALYNSSNYVTSFTILVYNDIGTQISAYTTSLFNTIEIYTIHSAAYNGNYILLYTSTGYTMYCAYATNSTVFGEKTLSTGYNLRVCSLSILSNNIAAFSSYYFSSSSSSNSYSSFGLFNFSTKDFQYSYKGIDIALIGHRFVTYHSPNHSVIAFISYSTNMSYYQHRLYIIQPLGSDGFTIAYNLSSKMSGFSSVSTMYNGLVSDFLAYNFAPLINESPKKLSLLSLINYNVIEGPSITYESYDTAKNRYAFFATDQYPNSDFTFIGGALLNIYSGNIITNSVGLFNDMSPVFISTEDDIIYMINYVNSSGSFSSSTCSLYIYKTFLSAFSVPKLTSNMSDAHIIYQLESGE